MHTINIRNLFNIRRPQIALLLGLSFIALNTSDVSGQNIRRKHLEYYDDKPIHYGILFAVPFTDYRFSHNTDFLTKDSAFLVESPKTAAFRMGFTINAFLNDRFDIRTTPSVSLYDRQLRLSYPNGSSQITKRESTWVEIPLLLKYKSKRRGNNRMYMIAGCSLGLETNVKRNRGGNSAVLDTRTSDFTFDYGVGFERFFEFFKFAPELRFSHGMGNVLNPSTTANTMGIKNLRTHTVTLYLNFE
ncbi:outer membrane protein with beta-barrel domain [Dyadobacter jejuensis]|uniref:Outer membrane protein with beta-barrel domain n=1 Tax=Dyadobacter jejuensis TaxID=1082580 RepID=A0A316B3A0_9BACT|nr:outer membrane beta-barrel protein [Dyadobacter jejuensis]PWJ57037.1 outer membrane protein with beta-barrel domain [Dyadobacter jejuensis]